MNIEFKICKKLKKKKLIFIEIFLIFFIEIPTRETKKHAKCHVTKHA